MSKTVIVAGYGPGISAAVARRFGREGFSVALVSRNPEHVKQGARDLTQRGITAQGFATDVGDPEAIHKLINDVHETFGQVTVLHWNAYATGAGDLIAQPEELRMVFDVSVHGLLTAVTAVLPDLKAQKGAVLVTGGGFAFYDANVDTMAVQVGLMGLATSKATQHKLVGLLNRRLADEGVFVGEATVVSAVKGTQFDSGQATLESDNVADAFWKLYTERGETWITVE